LACVHTPYYERNDGSRIIGVNQNIFVRVVTQGGHRRGSNSSGLIEVTGGIAERYVRPGFTRVKHFLIKSDPARKTLWRRSSGIPSAFSGLHFATPS